jgi:hypothetical protein
MSTWKYCHSRECPLDQLLAYTIGMIFRKVLRIFSFTSYLNSIRNQLTRSLRSRWSNPNWIWPPWSHHKLATTGLMNMPLHGPSNLISSFKWWQWLGNARVVRVEGARCDLDSQCQGSVWAIAAEDVYHCFFAQQTPDQARGGQTAAVVGEPLHKWFNPPSSIFHVTHWFKL